MMTNRERFLRVMNYQTVDRLPVLDLEPLEEMVIQRWRNEGLPAGIDHGPVETAAGHARCALRPNRASCGLFQSASERGYVWG
jgi:hypothetical protein